MSHPTSFARWLLRQAGRVGPIGALASAAKADPRFPKDGDLKAVWARVNELGGDDEVLLAMEDAQDEWTSQLAFG